MTEPPNPPRPLLDEVIAQMLVELQTRGEFDRETVESLERLAAAGNLKKPRLVVDAIKVRRRGDGHEAPAA